MGVLNSLDCLYQFRFGVSALVIELADSDNLAEDFGAIRALKQRKRRARLKQR